MRMCLSAKLKAQNRGPKLDRVPGNQIGEAKSVQQDRIPGRQSRRSLILPYPA
jgi:hypothetical protein